MKKYPFKVWLGIFRETRPTGWVLAFMIIMSSVVGLPIGSLYFLAFFYSPDVIWNSLGVGVSFTVLIFLLAWVSHIGGFTSGYQARGNDQAKQEMKYIRIFWN